MALDIPVGPHRDGLELINGRPSVPRNSSSSVRKPERTSVKRASVCWLRVIAAARSASSCGFDRKPSRLLGGLLPP